MAYLYHKMICWLSKIQMSLYVLSFYLLNLATLSISGDPTHRKILAFIWQNNVKLLRASLWEPPIPGYFVAWTQLRQNLMLRWKKKGVEEAQECVINPPDKAAASLTLSCPFLPRWGGCLSSREWEEGWKGRCFPFPDAAPFLPVHAPVMLIFKSPGWGTCHIVDGPLFWGRWASYSFCGLADL